MAKLTWCMAAASLGLLFAAPAAAATFTDSGAFALALSSSATADFDALGDGFYGGPGFGGIGTLTSDGVTISTTTNYLFTQATNQYASGTFVSVQQLGPAVFNVSFAASTAFGFNYDSAEPLTLVIGGQTFAIAASPFPDLRFFGVTSATPFSSVEISSALGVDVDNVTFGTAAVPEPASWLMIIGGFGLVGATLRRRPAGGRAASGVAFPKSGAVNA
jgi:hypothetical protein